MTHKKEDAHTIIISTQCTPDVSGRKKTQAESNRWISAPHQSFLFLFLLARLHYLINILVNRITGMDWMILISKYF